MIYLKNNIKVNADDFGLTPSVNRAIVQAFQSNLITSASIMANMPSFEEACALAVKNNLNGKIGVHLNLVEGLPITEGIKRLPRFCDEKGCFLGKKSRVLTLTSREKDTVEQELDAQIRKSIETGIFPVHLDSHHCYHRAWPICSIVIKLARKYGIDSVRIERNCGPHRHPVHKLYHFLFNSRLRILGLARSRFFGSVDDMFYDKDRSLEDIEIMVHPGLDSDNHIIDAWVTEPGNGIMLDKRLGSIGVTGFI
jgi:chitin disaccharide deacetylase